VMAWPSGAPGPAAAAPAPSWIVCACSVPVAGAYRKALSVGGSWIFVRLFLRGFKRPELVSQLETVAAYRLAARALPETERVAIRRLVDREVSSPRPGAP